MRVVTGAMAGLLALAPLLTACASDRPADEPVSAATTAPAGSRVEATAPTSAPPASATRPATPNATAPPPTGSRSPTPRSTRNASLDAPLITAAEAGDTARVRQLLARGAGVRASDAEGRTALVAAAYGNHLDVARMLIAAGADVNHEDRTEQSAFLIATSEVGDDPRLLDLTLAAGADVDAKDSFNGTGLIRAAERGNHRIVERLLATPMEVDHVNRLGWTALHEAVILGDGGDDHVRTVELLVDAGADVDLPSERDNVRPLSHARAQGFDRIAEVLENAGARP